MYRFKVAVANVVRSCLKTCVAPVSIALTITTLALIIIGRVSIELLSLYRCRIENIEGQSQDDKEIHKIFHRIMYWGTLLGPSVFATGWSFYLVNHCVNRYTFKCLSKFEEFSFFLLWPETICPQYDAEESVLSLDSRYKSFMPKDNNLSTFNLLQHGLNQLIFEGVEVSPSHGPHSKNQK